MVYCSVVGRQRAVQYALPSATKVTEVRGVQSCSTCVQNRMLRTARMKHTSTACVTQQLAWMVWCTVPYRIVGSSATYSCSMDGAWAPMKTTAGAETTSCQLLPPQIPYVEKVTAEDSALKVSFAVNAAYEAKYIVSATPHVQQGATETAQGAAAAAAAAAADSGAAEGGAVAVANTEITTVTGTAAEATVAGLTNGMEYMIAVDAINERGTQHATAYSSVAPTEVKRRFEELTSSKKAKEDTISSKEAKLKRDLGPGMQYSQMDDKCVEKEFSKFVYKICAFQKAEQKDGGSWNNLGNWAGWDHGKKQMKFNKGTKCWNGPQRSATVEMVCGPEDELLSVSEPETCEYVLVLSTPSVCTEADLPETFPSGDGEGSGSSKSGKDEL